MRILLTGLVLAACAVASTPGFAGPLITNGDFEQTTNGAGELGYNTDATGWTVNNGYTFLFNPGTADHGGTSGEYDNLQLWGPGNGAANGLPATSPTGGNFIALDGAFKQQPVQQTITGLEVGSHYDLTFFWAGAQQYTYDGATTEQFLVSLGNQTISTAVLQNASHGFTGWQKETFEYTATATSEVLSFLAVGTPDGEPPFSLLDGVDLQQTVPEPASLALLILGLTAIYVVRRRRA